MSSQKGNSEFMQYISKLAADNQNTRLEKFVEELTAEVSGKICEAIKEKIAAQAQRGSYTTSSAGKSFSGHYILPARIEASSSGKYTFSEDEVNNYMNTFYSGITYAADDSSAELNFSKVIKTVKKQDIIDDGGMKIVNAVKALAQNDGISVEEAINYTLTVSLTDDSRSTSKSIMLKYELTIPE